jgi:hypothetical protein
MNLLWRVRFVLWMAWWNRGSDIPIGIYWRWSADESDQSPHDAAMDMHFHMRQI